MGFAGSVMLETGIEEPFKDKNVVMLGAGGAAKAIAYIIIQKQCRSLTILNRSADRAQSLADHLMEMLPLMAETIPGFQSPVILADNSLKDSVLVPLSEADCVINTTAVGMGKTEGQLPVPSMEWVRKDQLCCDIIYTPLETEWLRQIREKGARGLNGTGMLAAQGILALELFTGRPHLLKDLYSNMVAEIQDQVKLTQAPRR